MWNLDNSKLVNREQRCLTFTFNVDFVFNFGWLGSLGPRIMELKIYRVPRFFMCGIITPFKSGTPEQQTENLKSLDFRI